MQAERKRSYHSEIAAAAAHRPEQVLVLVLIGRHEASVGENHVDGQQIVDRQTVFARQVADSTAQSQAAHAGGRNNSARHGQPERVRRVVHIAPHASARHLRRLGGRVHPHAPHARQVDHHAAVATPQARTVVSAAAHRQQDPVFARVVHARHHVCGVGAPDDRRRFLVDHRIVQFSGFIVIRVTRLNEVAAHTGPQDVIFCHRFPLATKVRPRLSESPPRARAYR